MPFFMARVSLLVLAVAAFAAWRRAYGPIGASQLLDEYDYIVIGAGSAGSVIAARLSEDADVSVLLVEAGGESGIKHSIPAACGDVQLVDGDWQLKTTPQATSHRAYTGQKSNWPRGKLLGGSSQLNYMAYVRGDAADYDSWAAMGNPTLEAEHDPCVPTGAREDNYPAVFDRIQLYPLSSLPRIHAVLSIPPSRPHAVASPPRRQPWLGLGVGAALLPSVRGRDTGARDRGRRAQLVGAQLVGARLRWAAARPIQEPRQPAGRGVCPVGSGGRPPASRLQRR